MEFLPDSLAEWVGVFVQLVGILLAVAAWVVRYIRDPIMTQLNGLGRRVRAEELATAETKGKIEELSRSDERVNFLITASAERQGRIEGTQEKMNVWLRQFEDSINESTSRTQSRLSGIEAKLDMLIKRN